MRLITAAALGVLALALVTLLAGTAEADGNVDVADFSYSPSSATIGTGESVTWTWTGSAPHSITFDTPGAPSDCGLVSSGSCSRSFPSAGTFAYHCAAHPSMTGSVTVNAPPPPPPPNAPPVASFTRAVSVRTVSVDGTASTDDGSIASWSWAWGDSTAVGSGATATHTYASPGTYTITLTVTDNLGLTATSSQQAVVANAAPTASFTIGVTDRAVSIDASDSADADGTIATFAWTLGDGGTASGATASHTYASDGTFTITLTVTDNDGATSSVAQQASVAAPAPPPPPPPPPVVVNQAPVANFTVAIGGLNVTVDAGSSSDADGTIVNFTWDFGDNATSHGVNVTHAYASAGNYTIRLSVTDDDGLARSFTRNVTVEAPPAPIVVPTVTPTPEPTPQPPTEEPRPTEDEEQAIEEPTFTTPTGTDTNATDAPREEAEPATGGEGIAAGAEIETTPTDTTPAAATPGAPLVALLVAIGGAAALARERR